MKDIPIRMKKTAAHLARLNDFSIRLNKNGSTYPDTAASLKPKAKNAFKRSAKAAVA